MDIEVGIDCFKQLAKALVVTAAEDTSLLSVATKPTGMGQARLVCVGAVGVGDSAGVADGVADGSDRNEPRRYDAAGSGD